MEALAAGRKCVFLLLGDGGKLENDQTHEYIELGRHARDRNVETAQNTHTHPLSLSLFSQCVYSWMERENTRRLRCKDDLVSLTLQLSPSDLTDDKLTMDLALSPAAASYATCAVREKLARRAVKHRLV